MDLESTLETLTSELPEVDLGSVIDTVTGYLPDNWNLEGFLSDAAAYIPAEIDFSAMLRFLLIFAGASLLVSLLGRVVLGKRSSLNHSVSSAMGILFIYAVTIVVYTFKPWNLTSYLSPLPFVTFAGEYMVILPFQGAGISAICHEVLSLLILAFLVNLLDTFIPKGKSVVSWYLLRFVTIVLAMALHLLVDWAFNTYMPDVLVTYAPVILLGILVAMLLLGLLNLILSAVLAVVDPIIGAIYTFFFSNIIGKQLTKAVVSTGIICAVVFLLGHFGYTLVCITQSALMAYIPAAAVLLILWYVIGHIL